MAGRSGGSCGAPLIRLAFDTETNGLLDKLTKIHSLVIVNIDTLEKLSLHGADVERGVRMLQEADLIVGHNIIKFDLPAIKKVYPWFKPKGKIRDTIVLSRLLHPDIKDEDFAKIKKRPLYIPRKKLIGSHSLEAWGYRLNLWKGDYAEIKEAEAKALGITDKDEIVEFVWGQWSPEMQEYCEQDVAVTLRLWLNFLAELGHWPEEAIELEHRVSLILFRQEQRGFGFDVKKAAALFAELSKHHARLEKELQEAFGPECKTFIPKANNKKLGYVKGVPFEKCQPFNPGSRKQVAKRLQALGWEPVEFGQDGVPTVNDEILKTLPYPQAKLLAEFYMVQKRLGQLATGKEALLKHERNGRIHGGVTPQGTPTRRMTHQSPNIAQVPGKKDRKTGQAMPYGKEFRDCFIASEGLTLVGVDADALELRDLAGYMAPYDGGAYIKTVLEGKKEEGTDMHTVNANALGGVDREVAKVWFYAFIYGAGDYKLGTILGVKGSHKKISAAGKASREKFLRNLPALGTLIRKVKAKYAKVGFLKALDGGKLHVRKEHSALNTLLQSAGAIQMKKALVILDDELQARGLVPGVDYEFVANVHDEWQIEVKEELAKQVGEAATDAIRAAGEYYNFLCPLKGNASFGKTWAETH